MKKTGVDKMGVYELGVDKMGSRRSGMTPALALAPVSNN